MVDLHVSTYGATHDAAAGPTHDLVSFKYKHFCRKDRPRMLMVYEKRLFLPPPSLLKPNSQSKWTIPRVLRVHLVSV